MPQTLPIRNLGDAGVVTDQEASSLPVQAFTRAKNVRFDDGGVVKSPVFRKVKDNLGFNPIHMYGITTDSGYNTVLLVSDTFNIKEYANGNVTNIHTTAGDVLSPYCNTYAEHFGGNASSAVYMTISNESSTSLKVTVRTAVPGTVLTDIVIPMTTPAYLSLGPLVNEVDGSISRLINFSSTPSSNVEMNVLWGQQGFAGLWQLRDPNDLLSFPFDAVCMVPGAYSASGGPVVTSTHLANQVYINRSDEVPVTSPIDTLNFGTLANFHGPANEVWKCGSLRAFGDFLIALNMREGGFQYPNRIRFSDLTLANTVPSTWDASDTTKSAGFIDLVEMRTGIVDGMALGTNFIIYSKDQVWMLEFVGGTFIMNTRKIFSDAGIINHNCAVEVERKHYVFSDDDIYVHDGNTRQSIVDNRVRNYIFNGLDTDNTGSCFVQHNPDTNEIYFCYKSGDDMAEFTNGTGCNRAAAYNYRNDTWSFLDLPNVTSGTIANVNTAATYDSLSATDIYATFGGTYHSQGSGFDSHTLFCGPANTVDGISTAKMYGLDAIEYGTLSLPLDSEANKPVFLQRSGIDLDELSTLSGYKVISAMLPQITTPSTNKDFEFNFGAANIISDSPTYETTVTFDAGVDYKMDSRASGRYLSYKMTTNDYKDFAFTGFDADVSVTGRR